MPEAGTGLSRRQGKCAGKSRWINQIRPELVFRGSDHQCSHNPNEISSLRSELVFRKVPGKLVQGRGKSQWFCRWFNLGRPLINPVGDGVARVPAPPTGLGLLPPRRLTLRFTAGVVAASYSRVRPEPPSSGPLAW